MGVYNKAMSTTANSPKLEKIMLTDTTQKPKLTEQNGGQTPQAIIQDWIGHVSNLHRLSMHDLKFDNKWRVSVYVKEEQEHCLMTKNTIAKAYFLQIVDGEVVDLTVQPKEKKKGFSFYD